MGKQPASRVNQRFAKAGLIATLTWESVITWNYHVFVEFEFHVGVLVGWRVESLVVDNAR